MRALVLDKASWKRHIILDKLTGLDPPGVKLRAAQGFGGLDCPSHVSLICIAFRATRLASGTFYSWDQFHDPNLIPEKIC